LYLAERGIWVRTQIAQLARFAAYHSRIEDARQAAQEGRWFDPSEASSMRSNPERSAGQAAQPRSQSLSGDPPRTTRASAWFNPDICLRPQFHA